MLTPRQLGEAGAQLYMSGEHSAWEQARGKGPGNLLKSPLQGALARKERELWKYEDDCQRDPQNHRLQVLGGLRGLPARPCAGSTPLLRGCRGLGWGLVLLLVALTLCCPRLGSWSGRLLYPQTDLCMPTPWHSWGQEQCLLLHGGSALSMATGAPWAGLRGRSGQAGWRVGLTADLRLPHLWGKGFDVGASRWLANSLPPGCTGCFFKELSRAPPVCSWTPGRWPFPGLGACLGWLAWQLLTTPSGLHLWSFHLQKVKEAVLGAEAWPCSDRCQQQHFLGVPTVMTLRPGQVQTQTQVERSGTPCQGRKAPEGSLWVGSPCPLQRLKTLGA